MKVHKNIKVQFILPLSLGVMAFLSCEREFSDDVEFASFPSNADVFLDDPVGLTDEFFESFDPLEGYNTEAFDRTTDVFYDGTASIRIDVPADDNPDGFQVGGIFRDRGAGRNLTPYDALTFWLRGSTTATIAEFGFGTDFDTADPFAVKLTNVRLTTDWKKIIIPIPDPSKLVQERGLFSFIAGSLSTGGAGYTFWIDEIKFENLGTIGQPRPAILNGVTLDQEGFLDAPVTLSGLTETFNLGSGDNVTVLAAPSYYDFTSSNPSVASVNELGVVSVFGIGETSITATLANVAAAGALNLNVMGAFDFPPTPPARNPEDVISVFSDAYTNINIDFFNGFFGGSTTLGGLVAVGDENVIRYTDLNFVTIEFANPTADASQMTHIHVDVKVDETLSPGDALVIELGDFGANGVFNGLNTDDSVGGAPPLTNELRSGEWVGIDIPLTSFTNGTGGGFTGLMGTSNLSQVSFVSGTISDISVDNIYFYRQ
ncbi:MAG: carbohydrate-binding protein [Bacteroidota bacterium]